MSDEISTDDLFGEDANQRDAGRAIETPKADRKPRAAKPKADPKPKPKPAAEPVDTAVEVTYIHWECACGNTNTLDLTRCGKCRTPRFTTS